VVHMTEPIFNVAQLLKEPVGAQRRVQVEADLIDLIPDLKEQAGGDETAPMVLSGTLRLLHSIEGVLVQGDLAANVTLQCARCLEPVSVPIEVPVEETFVPTLDIATGQTIEPEEEDRALWIDEHHILDLSEVLRQDVLVALPWHAVCRPDCRGLCPTCGENLNEGPCNCQAESDPRWAALRGLLNGQED
jgi:uncharacterized protein